MRAFEQGIAKADFVAQIKIHEDTDSIVRGRYWNAGKGCAVGCSLESVARLKGLKLEHDNHALYEEYLGIPEWLARLEDALFEGMTETKAHAWPRRFAEAIHVGADLEKAKAPFLIMILEHSLASMDTVKFDAEKWPDVVKAIAGSRAAVTEMIRCHREGLDTPESARSAAWSAWSTARSAAESAAWSARSAAAWSAARSARSAATDYYSERLLEILSECKGE